MDAEKRALVYARQNGRPVAPSPKQRRRMTHKAGVVATRELAQGIGATRRAAVALLRAQGWL